MSNEKAFGVSRADEQVEICLRGPKEEKVGLAIPRKFFVIPKQLSAGVTDEVTLAIYLPSPDAWSVIAEHPDRWPPHFDRSKSLEAQWPEARSIAFLSFASKQDRPEDGWRRFAKVLGIIPTGQSVGALDEFFRSAQSANAAEKDRSERERYYISDAANVMVTCRFPAIYCAGRSYVEEVAFRFLIHKSLLSEADNVTRNLAELFTTFLIKDSSTAICRARN